MSKIEIVNNTYTVEPLYQWDINQDIEIYGLSLPYIPEIHFTNSTMDKAIVRQASMNGAGVITARVPNSLLQKPYKITAYVCIYEGNTFRSLYSIEIPVKARSKPNDYTLENDEEVYSFNALENMVVNALAETEKAKSAYNKAEKLLEDTVDTIDKTIAQILDTTLTLSGKAADAKAVGDKLKIINETLNTHGDNISELISTRAKFASDSYIGTGTSGSNNPTVIPISFKPKLMVIGINYMNDIFFESCFGEDYQKVGDRYIKYVDGNVYIYSTGTSNAPTQFNASGMTYNWYIFA